MPKDKRKTTSKRDRVVTTWPYAKGFKPPTIKKCMDAIENAKREVHFDAPTEFFPPIPPPSCEDDWLAMYNEPGQTFTEFMEGTPWLSSRKRRYTQQRFVSKGVDIPSKYPDGFICLLPMGDFGSCNIHPKFDVLAAYTKAYIGLPVTILPSIDLEFNKKTSSVYWSGLDKECSGDDLNEESADLQRNYTKRTKLNARFDKASGTWQLCVDTVLDKLRSILPKNALCLVALTMTDLYCDDTDLFVAGMSAGNRGVAVFTFARYDPALTFSAEFWYEMYYSQTIAIKERKKLMLQRSCRLLVHEIGHLLGLDHCIWFQCCMNGSGHLAEDFSQPMSLCPVDLHKLQALCGFNVLERYSKLLAFYKKHSFKEEQDWVASRITHITKAK